MELRLQAEEGIFEALAEKTGGAGGAALVTTQVGKTLPARTVTSAATPPAPPGKTFLA